MGEDKQEVPRCETENMVWLLYLPRAPRQLFRNSVTHRQVACEPEILLTLALVFHDDGVSRKHKKGKNFVLLFDC